jgi:uncharacterized protein
MPPNSRTAGTEEAKGSRMRLVEEVGASIREAIKSKDAQTLGPLRMLKTALVNRSIEKGRDLEHAEALQVVATLIKQRRDSIEQFTQGGRPELADKEKAEIVVLERYLPPPVERGEVEAAVDEAISSTGASSPKDIGRVMKAAMEKLAGRGVDGRMVNELARAKLSGQ